MGGFRGLILVPSLEVRIVLGDEKTKVICTVLRGFINFLTLPIAMPSMRCKHKRVKNFNCSIAYLLPSVQKYPLARQFQFQQTPPSWFRLPHPSLARQRVLASSPQPLAWVSACA